jgi:hypothetical protein
LIPWLFFCFGFWGITPTFRDFKGDIKVSLRQKELDNKHPPKHKRIFLMMVLITLMRIEKTQYSKGSSNYVFGIVIAWGEKFNG